MPNLAQVEEYQEERYELIKGEETIMSAASLPHLDVQSNLHFIIKNYLRGKRCKVYAEARVVLDDKNWLQPDIAVVCDKNKLKHTYIDGAPDFVAEIISPSSLRRDFATKKDLYEKFGVKEYWIVDPMARNIFTYILQGDKYVGPEIYHLFSDDEWECLTERERSKQEKIAKMPLKISLYDGLEIDIGEVFAR